MYDNLKSNGQNKLAAGKFSDWLNDFTKAMEGRKNSDVPCGQCVACCTSSTFVHIRPTDKDTLRSIPEEILFPAPGLPKGNYLLGYDEKGYCPMFKAGKCSIYEIRPETCRQYDCRVYPATGIPLEQEKSKIAKQVKRWSFDISPPDDIAKYNAVQQAAAFLLKYRDRFPTQYILKTNVQLAVFAIRIYKLFIGRDLSIRKNDVQAIVNLVISKYGNDIKKEFTL